MAKDEKDLQKNKLARQIPPPLNLPLYGSYPFQEITYLGKTNFLRGIEEKSSVFGIKRKDRDRNMLVVGSKGMGKSRLLDAMIRQDLDSNFGLIVFDFNGDLCESILKNIPSKRGNDVCFFDILNQKRIPALNPFSSVNDDNKNIFVEGFLKILPYYIKEWNNSLEYLWFVILNTILSLKKNNNFGFVYDLINNDSYRKEIIKNITDKNLLNFWEKDYEKMFSTFYEKAILPTNFFLERLFLNKTLKKFFYVEKSLINIEQLINNNKIILINLPYSLLDNYVANFLRDLMLLQLKIVGVSRSFKNNLKTFYIYIDDMESKNEDLLEDLLKGTNYSFSFVIALKSLNNISQNFASNIFSFIGNYIIFKLLGSDVLKLEKEFASPNFRIKDALDLNIQEFYAKLLINGIPSDFFYAETLMVEEKGKFFLSKEEVLKKSSRFYIEG